MAHICSICFHIFEEKWKSSELYLTEYIHKLSYIVKYTTFAYYIGKVYQDKQKRISTFLVLRDFLQCEFMGIFPIKLENKLIINLYHTEKAYSNGDYYIYFNCSGKEREVHRFFKYPYVHMYPLWYMIHLLKEEWQMKEFHIAFTQFDFLFIIDMWYMT